MKEQMGTKRMGTAQIYLSVQNLVKTYPEIGDSSFWCAL